MSRAVRYQPVPDPGNAEEYARLLLAGVLIDMDGQPLVVEPCEHGDWCGAEYHILNITDPTSMVCPRCGRGPGEACRFPRPSQHVLSAQFARGGRSHKERELAAQEEMDRRAAAGDLTVPAPWLPPPGRHRMPVQQTDQTEALFEVPPNSGHW